MKEIGCFVSSHGFGHATRVVAIIEALSKHIDITARLFTTVKEEIFRQSLPHYTFHHQLTDIGFIQDDAFHLDIKTTCSQLDALIPYRDNIVKQLAEKCRGCSLIICDISGLGIKVAKQLAIPAVLIENFTWDFLYAPFIEPYPELRFFCDYLASTYRLADIHIQTEPLCRPGNANLTCSPIYRAIRENPYTVRSRFPCGSRKVVLVTLGGISFQPGFFSELAKYKDYFFIFGGQQRNELLADNVQLLGRFSDIYYPDLINCVDLVVFKGGYSTLAECYQSGTPAICIKRDDFAESRVLERYAEQHLQARILSQDNFITGRWLNSLDEMPLRQNIAAKSNGADKVAKFLLPYLT